MKIVVLDGYTLNPGDMDWAPLQQLGACDIHMRTAHDQLLERAAGAKFY
jgi:glycerate dehydrogenase